MGNPINTECPPENQDCLGICGGDNIEDDCGVCGGDGSTCNISYSETVQPIFNTNCIVCHGGSSGLVLDSYSSLMEGGYSGSPVIPGNGAGSLIIQKLRGTDLPQMPNGGPYLDEIIIDLIEAWIDEGALDN